MNRRELEIKDLFNKQEDCLFYQSSYRKQIYFNQLSKFKYVYPFGNFVIVNKIPIHLMPSIQTLKRNELISRHISLLVFRIHPPSYHKDFFN